MTINNFSEKEAVIDGHLLKAITLNPDSTLPPIVLFHGLIVSAYGWRHAVKDYLPFGRCIAISLPGHYPALYPPGFSSKELTTEKFIGLMDKALDIFIGKTPVVLMGISTGVLPALSLAARRPEQIRSVISVSGFSKGKLTGLLGLYQWVARSFPFGRKLLFGGFSFLKIRSMFPWTWRIAFHRWNRFPKQPEALEFTSVTYPYFKIQDPTPLIDYLEALPDWDITDELSKVQCPTLIITGENDPFIPLSVPVEMAKRIPSSELKIIPDAGHIVFLEKPNEMTDTIQSWFAKHPHI